MTSMCLLGPCSTSTSTSRYQSASTHSCGSLVSCASSSTHNDSSPAISFSEHSFWKLSDIFRQ